MTGEVFVAGHSRGGPGAALYAFSRLQRGLRVDGIYLFEPAMPGNHVIGQVLAQVPIRFSTWNLRDPVPAMPIDLECLNEEYLQPWPTTELQEQPPLHDPWGWWADHHMFLCCQGVRKLPGFPGAAISLVDAADMVQRLYDTTDPAAWDFLLPKDGAFWSVKSFPGGAKLAIARGTVTPQEWLLDFDAVQEDVMGARASRGFWYGVVNAQDQLDAALA